MTILYVVVLIMMYIYSGMLVYNGDKKDKNLSYAFFGFSILISLLCILSLIKCDSKSKMIKYGMGISTILMFIFLVLSIVFAKPKSENQFDIITYVNMVLVFIINMYATLMVIGPSTITPIFDTSLETAQ